MADRETVVGIDLGTTNSEVAAFLDGRVQVLGPGGTEILPSCVGLSPSGELLVGETARNQQLLYPDRTVRSIKRKMGADTTVQLGDRTFTPPEVSSLLLRELARWAEQSLGAPVQKAVITVPAYFTDAQRQATREAGALAGLDVVRILNEPTAAALAYGFGDEGGKTAVVYDLGGGTFDVSVVRIEGEVTEVLASHGNNHLGGDDFDDLLLEVLAEAFQEEHGIDVREGHPLARTRLWWAAEEAKKRLSYEPFVTVREDALVTVDGKPLHLVREITRDQYETLIRPLVESTLDSVSAALTDAQVRVADIDAVLMVGGATRTPLIAQVLEARTGQPPRQDVHPDLCVALGAGVLASRLGGHEVERVLVDVSPYSFGISFLGERGGFPYPYCYRPIIRRNTALPITRTEAYQTSAPYQTAAEINIFQGEDDDALKNVPVGEFVIEGLRYTPEINVVLCRMTLDIDGILHVTATEKDTGLSKHITVKNALKPLDDEQIAEARRRLELLYSGRRAEDDEETAEEVEEEEYAPSAEDDELIPLDGPDDAAAFAADPEWEAASASARQLLERSRHLLDRMHADDREEALDLHEKVEDALETRDSQSLSDSATALKELLFFIEGR